MLNKFGKITRVKINELFHQRITGICFSEKSQLNTQIYIINNSAHSFKSWVVRPLVVLFFILRKVRLVIIYVDV